MSELTKEWLLKTIAELEEERDAVPGAVNEDAAMSLAAMKRALASLEAEAVALRDERSGSGGISKKPGFNDLPHGTRLYPAPPAPVGMKDHQIRELVNELRDIAFKYHGSQQLREHIARTIRAAMLQGSEPVTTTNKLPEETGSSLQLRNLIRQRHAEWSQATFGDVGPVGPLKHLSKEALEAAEEPDDLSEWADMQFLLWDAQRRAGISDGEITAAMEEKLKVNMARQWPEPKDGEPRLHIKAAPQQEVK